MMESVSLESATNSCGSAATSRWTRSAWRGSERLKAARVLCVGAGGLGSPAALYLAAAGVGTIGLVEFDTVDVTNLQRQVLYTTADVGRPKLEAAAERLQALNPHVNIEPHAVTLDASNALELVSSYDVDPRRHRQLHRAVPGERRVRDRRPPERLRQHLQVRGAGVGVCREGRPCYRCLHPEPPPPGLVPNCAEAACSACCPGSSARSRRPRRSSCCSGSASR